MNIDLLGMLLYLRTEYYVHYKKSYHITPSIVSIASFGYSNYEYHSTSMASIRCQIVIQQGAM